MHFVIDRNIDLTQNLSILDTVSVDTQFLSILSFCRYSVSVDTQFLSILSVCRYSVSVDTQFLSILSFCRYSVSVDTQFLSILSFFRYSVSFDTQFLSILSFFRYSVSIDTQFLSILSFSRYSVSVVLSFSRYSVSVDTQFLSIFTLTNHYKHKNTSMTSIFPCWLDVMYQTRSSVFVTRISLGSMTYADLLSTSSRRLIFGGPVIALGLIGNSLFTVKSELMKHTRRLSISLVSETSMFS